MAIGGVSYLFGWSKPQRIAKSSPLIVKALRRILARYGHEGADKARRYAPVDTSLYQKSITAQPDGTEPLLYWVGSSLPYASKLEFLWAMGMPFSRNTNPNASSHAISRGVRDILDEFKKACGNAVVGEWKKI